jgi:hypothetical protein
MAATETAQQQKLAREVQGAIDAGEAEIGSLCCLLHAVQGRVNALIGYRATLQANTTEIEIARISSELRKLKTAA